MKTYNISIERPIAYCKLDKQNQIFSSKALKKMCKDTKLPIIITENFSYTELPVGKVTNLKFKEGKLIASIELFENAIMPESINDYCFRVGGVLIKGMESKIEGKTLVTKILEMKLMQIGLINKTIDVYDEEDA